MGKTERDQGSPKGQTVNMFGFVGHMLSVATTSCNFVYYNTKATMNNLKQMGVAVLIKSHWTHML